MSRLAVRIGLMATWSRNATCRRLPGVALLGALLLPASLPAGGPPAVRGPSSREAGRGPSGAGRDPVALGRPLAGASATPYPSTGPGRQLVYRIRGSAQGRGKGGG